jgi:hypothetical protein
VECLVTGTADGVEGEAVAERQRAVALEQVLGDAEL